MKRLFLALIFPVSTSASEITSPWTTSARTYLLTGTALTLTLVALDGQVDEPFQKETVEDKPLGSWHIVGDYGGRFLPNALYTGGMALTYWIGGQKSAWLRAGIMLRASAYAILTTQILKYTIQQERPNKADHLSFPSGHSTSAFAFAGVVTAEHGIWPFGAGAIALATLTAYSRINDNEHYLHDVVAGATIGAAFGLGVSYYNRPQTGEPATTAFIWPYYTHDQLGLSYTTIIP
jgi:membrane-associated phospholipid phosphatase